MAKAVADVVLVNGDFASIPNMVAEGRRILRNIQRVTKLFVTKSVFAAFVIVAVGITPAEYPLLPRHLTIVGALTVGIPAFFLALAPSDGPWRTDGFLREVGRFAVPAGVAAGLGVTTTYLIALNVFDLGLLQSRTAATSTLVVIGLYLVLALEATSTQRARLVGVLCGGLLLAYLVVLALPGTRRFFELAVPNAAAARPHRRRLGDRDRLPLAHGRPLRAPAPPGGLIAPGYHDVMAVTHSGHARHFRAARGLPVPRGAGQREAARLPRLGLLDAEAPPGARPDARRSTSTSTRTSIAASTGSPSARPRATRAPAAPSRAFVNAPSAREMVFTRSATEALNLVAYAWGLENLGPGDTVVITELEHHANFVPWQFIASRTGASFRHIPIDD